jgi:hypothetical protein
VLALRSAVGRRAEVTEAAAPLSPAVLTIADGNIAAAAAAASVDA